MSINLKNKIVIITGSSAGIGKACVSLFANANAKIVLTARRLERLQEIKTSLNLNDSNCICIQADLTDESQVKNLFTQTINHYGKVDILINNAGAGIKQKLIDISLDDFKNNIDANLTTAFLCTKEAILNNNHKLHIINVCSVAGIFYASNYSAYCAAKHAMKAMTKCLRREVDKSKIKISLIYPFRTRTEFFKDYDHKPKEWQMIEPEHIAKMIIAIAKQDILKIAFEQINIFTQRIKALLNK